MRLLNTHKALILNRRRGIIPLIFHLKNAQFAPQHIRSPHTYVHMCVGQAAYRSDPGIHCCCLPWLSDRISKDSVVIKERTPFFPVDAKKVSDFVVVFCCCPFRCNDIRLGCTVFFGLYKFTIRVNDRFSGEIEFDHRAWKGRDTLVLFIFGSAIC